jgi:hypothetical protein
MADLLEGALVNAVAGMATGPRPLRKAVEFYASQDGTTLRDIEEQLARRIRSDVNDTVRNRMRMALSEWDWEQDAPWTAGTKKVSAGRRELIYRLLGVGEALKAALEELPYYRGAEEIFIQAPLSGTPWYTADFRAAHDFYWKRLQQYLREMRGMSPDAVASLGTKASRVLAQLGDPAGEVKGSRGLVVGYVQSGKTTNFTAVIAKAIDAGYRLIIVLSGTTNLLRNQTQRRLDMELAGYENVLRNKDPDEEHDYSTDPAWPKRFIRYSRLPSLLGSVDILRLTGREDFQSHAAGINPLEFEFEKREKLRPLFDRVNLDHASARVVIAKKQRDRLKKLCKLLRHVGSERCSEIPALVIDDESDQASVNTVNPRKQRTNGDEKERTAINGYIVEMLRLLPRAQYIGYTATPFANCFVNPDDPADIYPSDFMVSLERPGEYMGASDFHDFHPVAPDRMSNEAAHVRSIPRDEESKDDLLAEAIDAFVLTAAIKEFRTAQGGQEFRHHTMLVHDSPLQGAHDKTAERIRKLWKAAGYDSPAAVTRLWDLLVRDYRPVNEDRGAGLQLPTTGQELKTHLGSALAKIRNSDPVLIVNSAEGADVPDFDKTSVWKIIVGGTKLSRGYTVEGLTISYFRRRAGNQDTLMQMGRWFGFRPGYRDLVRLYIGRAERDGKRPPFDLYKAFEALCRDEEDFREQLKMYELGPDGKPGLTPRDVPALVFNTHPRLRPTAANKMFNADITWAAFLYREPTQQDMSVKARKHNEQEFAALLASPKVKTANASVKLRGKSVAFDVKWRRASNSEIVSLIAGLDWGADGRYLRAETEFLKREPPAVSEWIMVVPQLVEERRAGVWRAGKNEYRRVERERLETRFAGFSSPEHVKLAKWLVGRAEASDEIACAGLTPDGAQGVMLVYPTAPTVDRKLQRGPTVIGFALLLPEAPTGQRIAFTAHLKTSEVVVPVTQRPRKAVRHTLRRATG